MATRSRHGGYLFQRPGSANWYVKLRSPGKRLERSLGTPDKLQAEIAAAPLVAAHKAALLALRPRLEAFWAPELEPGREHAAPDGGKIVATDRELIHISHNGAILKIEANGGFGWQIVGHGLSAKEEFATFDRAYSGTANEGFVRQTVPTKNGDDAILETYLKHANVTGYFEREARATWSLFRSLCNKPLKDASRDDGRKLVAHFESKNLKSASISKKIGWLTSAVNLAIREGKLKFNPFSSIVPNRDDAQRRVPLDDADIAECKARLANLCDADQMLFRLLATSGMRLGEAFQINGEKIEGGVRYVIVGSKTEQSLRRVPLPADVLPYLPATIKGKLFDGKPAATSKRLMRFLRDDCGITDPAKVVHSLRHRAKDRLRAAACPINVQYELLGHEDGTVAADYGLGSPVPLLKKWIDRIGF